ncbi:MAG: hypothetical protein NTY53_25260 [Kiritimatiellaeota bacterium]|nr:hypothetical protein [Kiritimatiellota bacterium]
MSNTNPPAKNILPVFALEANTTWHDMQNAIHAAAAYQRDQGGNRVPIFLFAPLTEPENLDAWEPMKIEPENLLVVSLERKWDEIILQALAHARLESDTPLPLPHGPEIDPNFDLPLADLYRQLVATDSLGYFLPHLVEHAPSMFFVRGTIGVRTFKKILHRIMR